MTEQQLQDLIKDYHVPKHILAHMRKVSAIALFIGQKLKQNGEPIDLIKLRQGALLHDLVKLTDFPELNLKYFQQECSAEDKEFLQNLIQKYHKDKHIIAGYKILSELNEEVLALIIRRHGLDGIVDPEIKPVTWEEKLVHYADKRVRHDEVVSLEERLEDLHKRYKPNTEKDEKSENIRKAITLLEQEICEKAGITPTEINEKTVEPFLENNHG